MNKKIPWTEEQKESWIANQKAKDQPASELELGWVQTESFSNIISINTSS